MDNKVRITFQADRLVQRRLEELARRDAISVSAKLRQLINQDYRESAREENQPNPAAIQE